MKESTELAKALDREGALQLRRYQVIRYGGVLAGILCVAASRLEGQSWDTWVWPACGLLVVAFWAKRSEIKLRASLAARTQESQRSA